MGAPNITYTFTNATVSDGPQVSTNFTDLINDMSDGTTDFHIGSLNVEGAVTLDGTVTLGDSSSDDLTFTGSIASHIPWKTNALYDLGAATLAPRSIYIGNGTKSTRILAGTVGTSYTITLPDNVSSVGQSAFFSAAAVMTFRWPEKFTSSQTSGYTATGDETIIPCAPAASFTLSLPAASTMTGKSLKMIKTDSDFTKIVTVDPNGAELINGAATTTLSTQYEALEAFCDGSAWHAVRTIHGPWTAYTPTWTGFGTVATTGTMWRRVGNCIEVSSYWTNGTVAASLASITLPTGLAIDTTAFARGNTTAAAGILVGHHGSDNSLANSGYMVTATGTSTSIVYFAGVNGSGFILLPQNGSSISQNSMLMSCTFRVPISGWGS